MNVSAVIVTRGDVDVDPVLDSLPDSWERVVWDNGQGICRRHLPGAFEAAWSGDGHGRTVENLTVYGRYSALATPGLCDGEIIYVQDDDCLLPAESLQVLLDVYEPGCIVANMPQRFHDTGFYDDHCLVGFGAIFDRDLPAQAFARFAESVPNLGLSNYGWWLPGEEKFNRTCDIVFTALTPRILVDLPYTDREFASAPNRMYRQPEHVAERTRMLQLVRHVRDREAA